MISSTSGLLSVGKLSMTKIARGDIVIATLDPTLGHEQAKRRPCLVVSDTGYNNRTKFLILCPITSKAKGFPFEVPISTGKISGVVLVDQIRSIDSRVRQVITTQDSANFTTMGKVSGLLEALLIA